MKLFSIYLLVALTGILMTQNSSYANNATSHFSVSATVNSWTIQSCLKWMIQNNKIKNEKICYIYGKK